MRKDWGNRLIVMDHSRRGVILGRKMYLKFHLCSKKIIASAECLCGHHREDSCHYFLECPLYESQRKRMLHNISNILAPGVNPNLIVHSMKDRLIEILLKGSEDIELQNNISIFSEVHKFIKTSKRFI